MIKKLNKLKSLNTILFVLLFVIVGVFFSSIMFILEKLGVPDIKFLPTFDQQYDNIMFKFIVGVLIAPPIETFIAQTIPYFLMSKIKYLRKNWILIVVIAGILFGLGHIYTLQYIVVMVFTGMLFMYAYILRRGREPFLTVTLIHMLGNLVVGVVNDFIL